MSEIGKLFLIVGILFIGVGLFLIYFNKFPFNMGNLPLDFSYKNENFSFYFPLGTSIIISIILSILFFIISKFLK